MDTTYFSSKHFPRHPLTEIFEI